jgi:peptidoglycan biosynthesis protein MviN/MurJ (putative lipid II flippase)
MFLTEFQVTASFLIYALVLTISAALILLKTHWTFEEKLLRLLILFLIPVLGVLILAIEFLIKKRFAAFQKKELSKT